MLKRLTVAAAALFALASQAFGAGTIPYSLSQQLDELGKPLAGCRLYLIQAGTVSTPQNGYQDSSLTIALPNPIICDASGRLPQFFLADGSIKVRLTKSNGTAVVTADGVLVVGASSGGGGGSPVDATTVLATGDLKPKYGTGTLSGFVRLNGRTIGSATSGATERANADTQALFEYLWAADINLSVSGGRGLTANADWSANKALTLPDFRGRVPAAMCDMGASDSGRLTSSYFGGTCTTLGAVGGSESHTLTTAETAAHTHSVTDPGHVHNFTSAMQQGTFYTLSGSSGHQAIETAGSQQITASSATTGITATNSTGGGGAHAIVQPTIVVTYYIKL